MGGGGEWIILKTGMFLSSDVLLYNYIYIYMYNTHTHMQIHMYVHTYIPIYIYIYIPILLMLLSQNFSSALSQKDTIMRPLRDGASVMQSREELKVSMA